MYNEFHIYSFAGEYNILHSPARSKFETHCTCIAVTTKETSTKT